MSVIGVDSALKDMAIVMKQLDRSDEAIEDIKSFRHLCSADSQESLDNVLVKLYKRSGRVEEKVEMLECKLKHIEEGTAFGGRRTKMARSQGKKVQITREEKFFTFSDLPPLADIVTGSSHRYKTAASSRTSDQARPVTHDGALKAEAAPSSASATFAAANAPYTPSSDSVMKMTSSFSEIFD